MPSPPFRRVPVDLILHATVEAADNLAKQAASERRYPDADRICALVSALPRAIRIANLAEEWNASGDHHQAGKWLAELCTAGAAVLDPANAYTRTIEIAVARRLADTACSLSVTGDAEDTAQALTLWRAAEAIIGLAQLFGRVLQSSDEAPVGYEAATISALRRELTSAHDDRRRLIDERLAAERRAERLLEERNKVVAENEAWREFATKIDGRTNNVHDDELRARVRQALREEVKRAEDWRDETTAALATLRSTEANLKAANLVLTDWCKVADRRLQTITAADDAYEAVHVALGARDGEDNLAAAKRVVETSQRYVEDALAGQRAAKDELVSLHKTIDSNSAHYQGRIDEVRKERDDSLRLLKIAEDKVVAADARALGAHNKMKYADIMCDHVRKERDGAIAERDVLKGRDPCETCRNERSGAIHERDAMRGERDGMRKRWAQEIEARDTAIEARAQMQARLVAVERERDAAQDSEKWTRVAALAMKEKFAEELKAAQDEARRLRAPATAWEQAIAWVDAQP